MLRYYPVTKKIAGVDAKVTVFGYGNHLPKQGVCERILEWCRGPSKKNGMSMWRG